jgi:ubiquinone/menaquinone biosynthesis C-methylase UbiE
MSATRVLPAYSMNRPSFPRMYERSLVEPLFRPWAEALLDKAELGVTMRIIDVACGTGIVARLARQRCRGRASVVGVDVSAPMLEVAREIEPGIDWREGDAAALPIRRDEQFDRVLCQQGLQFFADRERAARELRRAAAPGGLMLAAVWRPAEEMPVFHALQQVAERHVGPVHDQRYAFGDGGALADLLSKAGFDDVQLETTSLTCRFPDGAEFIRMNAMALIGMSGTRSSDEERERLLEAVAEESIAAMRHSLDGSALVCEMRSNIAVGRA